MSSPKPKHFSPAEEAILTRAEGCHITSSILVRGVAATLEQFSMGYGLDALIKCREVLDNAIMHEQEANRLTRKIKAQNANIPPRFSRRKRARKLAQLKRGLLVKRMAGK